MVDELSQAEANASNDVTPMNYTGSGQSDSKAGLKGKLKIGKIGAGGLVGIGVAMLAVGVAMVGVPVFMIGALDMNLQDSLGFSGTSAILEEQAEYITEEMAKKGELPIDFANDLATAGLDVGQVTAKGDFIHTNKYIADIERLDDVAVVGSGFQAKGGEGELSFLFEGEVIAADDFVETVEANPRMYAAFAEGTNITAKFYYSQDVDKVYQDMGLTRYAYNEWQSTGDTKADEESFNEIMVSVLDSEAGVAGGYDCSEGGCAEASLSGDSGEDIVSSVGSNESGAELLNSAISAEEPYRAASAFMAIEEPLQRTRIDGDGPANEVMNTLNKKLNIKYYDASTGEEKTKEVSILETQNFAAATGGGGYSKQEAMSFSRDRVLHVTGVDNSSVIGDTAVSSDGRKKSNVAVGLFSGGADIENATSSASIGIAEKNSDLFTSVVGGNRIVEGGSFISNKINMRTLGAMPSDESTVVAYSHDVNTALARRAEAERATKSPFDISTPNTFMGSIVHGFAASMIRGRSAIGNQMNVASSIGAAVDYVGSSANKIIGNAVADGDDTDFLTTFGEACQSEPSIGAAADLYCTGTTTIYTGSMNKTADDWGDIADSDEYKDEFVLSAMDRWASGDVKDAGVCKKYKEEHGTVVDAIFDEITELFGVYDECRGVDDDIATAQRFVMNDDSSDVKKYSGFTLYNTVSSLLSGSQSEASKILEDYYARHPMDNSRAGILARRSGLTKVEAEKALAYADYLTMIARYDASERYAFGQEVLVEKDDSLVSHANKMGGELYCFRRDSAEYADARTRNYA
ncbi:hypothetical protein IKF87_00065 [Candidatus Saccharibacteria bacterium]|nr:hypothetical protein [Candidatus Saccharibacteria bacterium]